MKVNGITILDKDKENCVIITVISTLDNGNIWFVIELSTIFLN